MLAIFHFVQCTVKFSGRSNVVMDKSESLNLESCIIMCSASLLSFHFTPFFFAYYMLLAHSWTLITLTFVTFVYVWRFGLVIYAFDKRKKRRSKHTQHKLLGEKNHNSPKQTLIHKRISAALWNVPNRSRSLCIEIEWKLSNLCTVYQE